MASVVVHLPLMVSPRHIIYNRFCAATNCIKFKVDLGSLKADSAFFAAIKITPEQNIVKDNCI